MRELWLDLHKKWGNYGTICTKNEGIVQGKALQWRGKSEKGRVPDKCFIMSCWAKLKHFVATMTVYFKIDTFVVAIVESFYGDYLARFDSSGWRLKITWYTKKHLYLNRSKCFELLVLYILIDKIMRINYWECYSWY